MVKRLHHLNFIVRDLDSATRKFSALLDAEPGPVEELPDRGVTLRRFLIGETWIVLVSPGETDSQPARYLAEHGQGFFLASFEVDDLEAAVDRLRERGISSPMARPRAGLDDWRVMDLDPEAVFGIGLQLVQCGQDGDQDAVERPSGTGDASR